MAVQVPSELMALRQIWQTLKIGAKVDQASVARRSATIGHLVPGMVEAQRNKEGWPKLSTAYVSQMLNEDENRAPSAAMIGTLALSMEAAYQSARDKFSASGQTELDQEFDKVLGSLRLIPTNWGDTELPLEAFSENLIVDERFEERFALEVRQPRFAVGITGGYRLGKSTQLARALQHLRRSNYQPIEISAGSQTAESPPGSASVIASFATQLGGAASTLLELDDVMEHWLEGQPGRSVMVIEDVNLMATAANSAPLLRNMFRNWTQRVRRSTDTSPWRRLSILLSSTYAPDIARGEGIYSETPALTMLTPSRFEEPQVIKLIKLWSERQQTIRATAKPSDAEVVWWAAELVRYFGGHPYLIHDAIRSWAEGAGLMAPQPRTAGGDRFVQKVVEGVKSSYEERKIKTTVIDEDNRSHVVIGNELVLRNFGLVESGASTCPFVTKRILPKLAADQ